MKKVITLISTVVLCALVSTLAAQEMITQVFDNREEFFHISRLSDGNIMISGQSNELGSKSDLVMISDPAGSEIKRTIVCDTCALDAIIYSRETTSGDIIHVRTDGGVYTSDLELTESTLNYNIARDEFESIETYQVLQNNHFIIIVSYAVKNNVRGLLHTVVDTRNKNLISQKFNVTFPDIAGSIGIDLFSDQSVIDGYNEQVNGISNGNLLRLDRDRSEVLWSVDLDFADLTLENALVSWDENIYAVGRLVDVNNPDSWLGLLVSYDSDGNHRFTKTFEPSASNNNMFEYDSKNFKYIEQVGIDRFIITGYQGGRRQGETLTDALVVEINGQGDVLKEHVLHMENRSLYANDFLFEEQEIAYIGKIFNGNLISGSFISLLDKSVPVKDEESISFGLAPNPAKTQILISGMESISDYEVTITDINGRLVLQVDNQSTMPVQQLAEGTYFLTVQLAEGTRSTRKFIKIK